MASDAPVRIQQIIKNLEGVLKTSRSEEQKLRVTKDIQKWKKELERLKNEEGFTDELLSQASLAANINPLDSYEFLKNIPIIKVNDSIRNQEVNEMYTFIKHIEDEYIGILSEYHLKTDYSHSMTRDSFYTQIHDCLVAFRSYADVAGKTQNDALPKEFRDKMKDNLQVEYRNIVTKIGVFLRKLFNFVDELIADHDNDGLLLNNALDRLRFANPTGDKKEKPVLDGCTVIEGLQDFHRYLTELLSYLNLPEIKKNGEKPF